jgi:hypothetical protein
MADATQAGKMAEARQGTVIGVSPALAAEFTARGYTDHDVARLLGPMAHHGELRLQYETPNGDRPSPLPSSLHRYYTEEKGFVAVAIVDPPNPLDTRPIAISSELREHANHDRVGVWTRGADRLESSCRNAFSLVSKGWSFVELADAEQRKAAAEARPFPKAPSAAPVADAAKGKK